MFIINLLQLEKDHRGGCVLGLRESEKSKRHKNVFKVFLLGQILYVVWVCLAWVESILQLSYDGNKNESPAVSAIEHRKITKLSVARVNLMENFIRA